MRCWFCWPPLTSYLETPLHQTMNSYSAPSKICCLELSPISNDCSPLERGRSSSEDMRGKFLKPHYSIGVIQGFAFGWCRCSCRCFVGFRGSRCRTVVLSLEFLSNLDLNLFFIVGSSHRISNLMKLFTSEICHSFGIGLVELNWQYFQ